jgi:hypothetical protein
MHCSSFEESLRDCGTLYWCITFCDAEHSRSGRAGPILQMVLGSRLSESPNPATMPLSEVSGYSGTILPGEIRSWLIAHHPQC